MMGWVGFKSSNNFKFGYCIFNAICRQMKRIGISNPIIEKEKKIQSINAQLENADMILQ